MQKKAVIILTEGFEEIETVTPADILRRGGVSVTLASIDERTKVKGSRGIVICADDLLSRIDASEFDVIILPGGPGAKGLTSSETVSALIKDFAAKGKLIAAICAAPAVVLAPTGVLDGKKATGYPGSEKDFRESTEFSQDSVVIDGNIITSRAPGTAAAFGFAVLETLMDKSTADKVKKGMLFT